MAVSQGFKNAVAARDLDDIRLSMCNELLIDPTFRNFAEMAELAAKVPGLYVSYDKGTLDTDRAHWDDGYLALQKVKLVDNFCPERIEHVKEVVRKLHPPKPASTAQTSARTESTTRRQSGGSDWSSQSSRRSAPGYEEQKRMDAKNGNIIKVVGCGVGGALLGAAVGSTAGGVIGALVGCGVGYVVSKR